MAQRFAAGAKGGVPPWKKGQKIDLKICHWCLWGPRRSGLYETTRELIFAENQIDGVLAGMCCMPPPKASKREQGKYLQGGFVDAIHPELRSQDWGWGMKWADIHIVHFSYDKRLGKLKPKAFFVHGTLEAVLDSSLREKDEARSLLSAAEWIDRFEATFVTSRRALLHWSVFDSTGGKKMHLINKGIDLSWYQRGTVKRDLPGEPSVLYGEVWRGIKHPAHLFYAINELYKENPEIRLNVWALDKKRAFWEYLLRQADFMKFMGTENLPGLTDYPEHFYNRGDVLVSPVLMGDVSRVHQEALACGCPVVAWDSDPWRDNPAYKFARAFDIHDLAAKIQETYDEVLDDREGVAKKCRAIAEEHFDMRDEAKSVVEVLRRVINES